MLVPAASLSARSSLLLLLPLTQIRFAYGKKKLVTVWRVRDGLKMQVDIRDAGKAKYSRTPPGVDPPPKKKSGKGKGRAESPEVTISKTMSWILRHGAANEGLPMRTDGFVRVQELLAHPKLKQLDFLKLESIVRNDEKQRYTLLSEPDPRASAPSTPEWWIRANQGHSMSAIQIQMTQIMSATDIPMAVHGTTLNAWDSIAKEGLSKMKRNHIHLAQGVSGNNVISGMRSSSQILIFIDVEKALAAGIKFYLSANGVVLTEGDEQGCLAPEFFKRVEDAKRVPLSGWDGEKAEAQGASATDQQPEAATNSLAQELEKMELRS